MTRAPVSAATGGVGPEGSGGMVREGEPRRLTSIGSWVRELPQQTAADFQPQRSHVSQL